MNRVDPPRIFDRKAYGQRRNRQCGPDADPFLAIEASEQIAARIISIQRHFTHALDLNSRRQSFAKLGRAAENWTRTGYGVDAPDVISDDEFLPFADGSFDLVTSVLSLHCVNDLPGTLIQIRRALKPDGAFLAALFGGETLRELRFAFTAAEAAALGGASPRIAPFADVRDLGGLLQRAGFALPVADMERTTVCYREPMRLLADLRALGETNVLLQRRPNFLSRRLLQSVIAEYEQRFPDDQGRITATFDIVYLIGWAPHESQQKPLRPGSAKSRLADALRNGKHETPES
jgi:SAM-dependent methyltransferase